jgi:hypothetical protein
MDHIDMHLTSATQNLKFSAAIRASLALGKAHLNKYYDATDHSEVYRIAMSKWSPLIIQFDYRLVEQSYTRATNYNISAMPTGTTHGSRLQLRSSMMNLCELMQTSPSWMRSWLITQKMYVPHIFSTTHKY